MPEGWVTGSHALGKQRKTGERLLRSLPGVKMQEERYGCWRNRQRLIRMTVDLEAAEWTPELHIPTPFPSLQPLTEQVRHRRGTVAAVNAAFFHPDGHPASVLIQGRDIVSFGRHSAGPNGYNYERQAFGYSEGTGRARIAPFAFHVRLTALNGAWSGSSVNRPITGKSEATLVTAPYEPADFLPDAEKLPGACVMMHLGDTGSGMQTGVSRSGTVRKMLKEEATAPLSDGTFLLYVPYRDNVPACGEAVLTIGVSPEWETASFLIGGGPMFDLTDKHRKLTMNPRSPAARLRAPRTAVFTRGNGRILDLIVVDGRHRQGRGVSLPDLWQYARRIGAESAMNLDGGGSSGVVLRDLANTGIQLVNAPSDGEERHISASLHLTERQADSGTGKGVGKT